MDLDFGFGVIGRVLVVCRDLSPRSGPVRLGRCCRGWWCRSLWARPPRGPCAFPPVSGGVRP